MVVFAIALTALFIYLMPRRAFEPTNFNINHSEIKDHGKSNHRQQGSFKS